MKIIFGVLLGVSLVTLRAVSTQAAVSIKRYHNETHGWSVELPLDWEDAGPGGPVEKNESPEFQGPARCYERKVNCYFASFKYIADKAGVEKEERSTIGKYSKNYELLAQGTRKLRNREVRFLRFRKTKPPRSESLPHIFEDVFVPLDKGAYLAVSFGETHPDTESISSRNNFSDVGLIERLLESVKEDRRPDESKSDIVKFHSPTKQYHGEVSRIGNGFNNRFRISVFRAKDGRQLYSHTDYAVHKDSSGLVAKMVWGPDEILLMLPDPGWVSYASSDDITILALKEDLKWTTGKWYATRHTWLDSFTLLGNQHNDCDYNVMIFDGKTGKASKLKADTGTLGWEIVKAVDNGILIRSLINNCGSDFEDFKPTCLLVRKDRTMQADTRCE